MRAITSLLESPNINYVFTGCCDSEVEIFLELEPGEADHEVRRITLGTQSPSTVEITEIGGVPYTTAPSSSIIQNLTQNIVLTQGNQISVKFKYCCNKTHPGTDAIILGAACANHTGNHGWSYSFQTLDIATSFNSIIQEASAIFTSCSNDCNEKKQLLHFNNPSSVATPITSTLSTACGFNFFIDGNTIDITDFQMPPGQSVLQINNPGCIVAAPCDFSIDFDFCGNTVSIPITHDIVNCGPCGIDCRGIIINSTPISMPKLSYGPIRQWDNGSSYSNWVATGPGGSSFPSFESVSPTNLFASYITSATTFTFSPNISTGDHVTIYWGFKTANVVNNVRVLLDGTITGGPDPILVLYNNLLPNTTYQGTIDVPFFVDPGFTNSAVFIFETIDITSGVEIYDQYLQVQKFVKPNLVSQANLDCSTLNSYNTTAIGDYKSVTFQYYYHNGFADFTQVFFNPWAFDGSADYSTKYPGGVITQPYSGFVVDIMSGWIGNGPQQMNFLGPNNQKNYKAYINLVNGNEFEIILEFFLIQDLLDWVDLYDTDNQRKLLYSSADPSTPILTNLVNSVYLNTKAFGSLLYIVDPNVITQYTGTPPKPVYYECYLDTKVMFDVRWWGQGIGGSFSEMTNPLFSFSRSSNPVTQLSTLHTTTVSFDVYYSGVIDNVIFWLFDTSNNDNSVDFYDNYDSSRALIPTIVTPGIIDNKLESPSVAVTSLGGGHYYVSATISKNLNPNGRYRLGAICYSSADDIVNSFLSDELTVKTTVDVWDVCCDMNVDVHWLDYVHDHNDACFMPTLKERIKNDMYITAGSFDGCLTALGMPPGKNYLDYLSAINLTIYQKRDTYPTPTDRTYFIYAKYQSIRDTSVSGNWINPDSRLFCSDDGTTLYTSWAGRVLWNDTLFNPNNVAVSTMNEWGIKYPTGAILGQQYVNFHNITYNWANQDIYFEYSFYFDLNPFLLNQTVVLTQINQLHPMDYANNILPPYDQIIDYMSLTGFKDGVATSFVGSTFCADKYDYVEVNVRLFAPYVDGKLIATLNYAPYTEFSIKEHESFTSTNMAQLTDIEMFNVDVDFFGGSANFAINTSMLPAGQYQICAIRIPD